MESIFVPIIILQCIFFELQQNGISFIIWVAVWSIVLHSCNFARSKLTIRKMWWTRIWTIWNVNETKHSLLNHSFILMVTWATYLYLHLRTEGDISVLEKSFSGWSWNWFLLYSWLEKTTKHTKKIFWQNLKKTL